MGESGSTSESGSTGERGSKEEGGFDPGAWSVDTDAKVLYLQGSTGSAAALNSERPWSFFSTV